MQLASAVGVPTLDALAALIAQYEERSEPSIVYQITHEIDLFTRERFFPPH